LRHIADEPDSNGSSFSGANLTIPPAKTHNLTHRAWLVLVDEWCPLTGNYGAGSSDEGRPNRVVAPPRHTYCQAERSLAGSDSRINWVSKPL